MKANLLREKVTEVGMFQPFCFNHIITDLSFIYIYTYIYIYIYIVYIYIYILQSGINEISSNRAQVDENASMRAVAKIFGARESEHPCNFCQQFKQRPNFVSTFKLNGTIRYPLKLHANSFSRMFMPLSLSNFFGSQILARNEYKRF